MIAKTQASAQAAEAQASLPEGWQMARFGDVVRNVDVNERDPLENGLERSIGLEHIDPDSLHIKSWGLVEEGTSFTRKFAQGQVLFGKRRVYQRKVAIAEFDGICSGDILVFEPANEQLIPELLPFLAQSEGFFQHALGTSAGSLSPRTRWRDLAEYTFPLPPRDEQRRIAEILWAAESEKRKIIAALTALEEVIAAIGSSAYSTDSGQKVALGHLAKLGLMDFQTGPFGTVLKASSYVSNGTPIINPVNMIDGRLEVSNGPFLSAEECERLSRFRMSTGDILLGRKGDMGRAVYIDEQYDGWMVGSDCILIRTNRGSPVTSKYLYRFLTSPQARLWLTRQASGTTMPGVNEKTLARLEIAVPDISIQNQIVGIFEQLDLSREALHGKLTATQKLTRALLSHLLEKPILRPTSSN